MSATKSNGKYQAPTVRICLTPYQGTWTQTTSFAMSAISKWILPVQTPVRMYVPFTGKLPKEQLLKISSFTCRKRPETHSRYVSFHNSSIPFTDCQGHLHGKRKWRFHEQFNLRGWKLRVRVHKLPMRKSWCIYAWIIVPIWVTNSLQPVNLFSWIARPQFRSIGTGRGQCKMLS